MSLFRSLLAPMGLMLGLVLPLAARAEVLDYIVAVVNEGVILDSDLGNEMESVRMSLRTRGIQAPDDSVLRAQVLEKVVLTKVQTQRAQQAGIRVDDRELNEVLNNIAKENNLTLAQFADMVRQEGGDYLGVREEVREEIVVARLKQKEVDQRITVTDQDIELFLASQGADDNAEYRLSHILVSIPDGASPEQREQARTKADGLAEQIRKGGDFSALAVSSSDGQQALQGGDLDWRKADNLPVLFLQAARKLQPGQVSPVLEAAGGYHLIKLVDLRGAGTQRKTVEETHSRHILIRPNAIRTEEQAQAQMRDISDRLAKGGDFAKLAREFSDDPGSKVGGGDLGWQPPGIFAPEFQTRMDSLKPGERSTPFRTQFGWHVVEVLDRRTRDITEDARLGRARSAIQNRKAAEEYDAWLRRLRAEAYVEFRGPNGQIKAPATPAPAAAEPATAS